MEHTTLTFNDYLKKVVEMGKVSDRRKILEIERVIKAVKANEPYEEALLINEMILEDVVQHLKDKYSITEILDEFDNDKLAEHIADEFFIADNEDHAVELLTMGGYIPDCNTNDGNTFPSSRKGDCLELINEIVHKEGWNYLYNILERQKDKLHLI